MRYKDGAYALDTEGSGETFAGRQRLQSLGEFPPVFLTFTFQMEQTDAEGAVEGAGAGVHSREWQKTWGAEHTCGVPRPACTQGRELSGAAGVRLIQLYSVPSFWACASL